MEHNEQKCISFCPAVYTLWNNNSLKHHKGDPLYKIAAILKSMSSHQHLAWNASIYLSIDESMIVYKGRSIKLVQYLPMKPIKHGIRAYYLCDANNGYLLAFEVYSGVSSGSTWGIIEQLLIQSGLANKVGCKLFMDNYYTTMKVVTKLYENHGWTYAGTVSLTKKSTKSCTEDDFPFPKLSNGAVNMVDRGWICRSTWSSQSKHGWKCVVQASLWKDKKIVPFLHTISVGPEKTTDQKDKEMQMLLMPHTYRGSTKRNLMVWTSQTRTVPSILAHHFGPTDGIFK